MSFNLTQFATIAGEEPVGETVSLVDAGIYSGLGIGIVFLVLVVLMAFIGVMSFLLRAKSDKPAVKPVEKKVEAPKVDAAPVAKPAAAAPSAVPEGAMFVTLGGKKHTVTVVEKIPQFTVKLNGKTHSVDVEPVQEV